MTHSRRLIRSLALSAAVALAVAACGGSSAGDGEGAASDDSQTEFTIELSEFQFSPADITLPAGKTVTLTLKNNGTIEHEFMLGKAAMEDGGYMEDLLAELDPEVVSGHGYALEGLEEGEHEEEEGEHEEGEMHHGAEIELEAGGEVTLKLTIPADASGTYEMGCFLPGHYDAGMKGTVTISG